MYKYKKNLIVVLILSITITVPFRVYGSSHDTTPNQSESSNHSIDVIGDIEDSHIESIDITGTHNADDLIIPDPPTWTDRQFNPERYEEMNLNGQCGYFCNGSSTEYYEDIQKMYSTKVPYNPDDYSDDYSDGIGESGRQRQDRQLLERYFEKDENGELIFQIGGRRIRLKDIIGTPINPDPDAAYPEIERGNRPPTEGDFTFNVDGVEIGATVDSDGEVKFSFGINGASGKTGTLPVSVLNQLLPVYVVGDDELLRKESRDKKAREGVLDELNGLLSGILNQLEAARSDKDTDKKVPAFVQDWRKFARQNEDEGQDIFNKIAAEALFHPEHGSVCWFYADQIAKEFNIKPPSKEELEIPFNHIFKPGAGNPTLLQRTQCPFPETIKIKTKVDGEVVEKEVEFHPDLFREDYLNGGDEILELLGTYNVFSLLRIFNEELSNQIDKSASANDKEAVANSGYLGVRDEKGTITTPGQFLSKAHALVLDTQLQTFVVSTEAKNVPEKLTPADVIFSIVGIIFDGLGGKASEVYEEFKNILKENLPKIIPNEGVPEIPDNSSSSDKKPYACAVNTCGRDVEICAGGYRQETKKVGTKTCEGFDQPLDVYTCACIPIENKDKNTNNNNDKDDKKDKVDHGGKEYACKIDACITNTERVCDTGFKINLEQIGTKTCANTGNLAYEYNCTCIPN